MTLFPSIFLVELVVDLLISELHLLPQKRLLERKILHSEYSMDLQHLLRNELDPSHEYDDRMEMFFIVSTRICSEQVDLSG